jgi:hypothetical protein
MAPIILSTCQRSPVRVPYEMPRYADSTEDVSMGSIHYIAMPLDAELRDLADRHAPQVRELTSDERHGIWELSATLEERTRAWIDQVNRSGTWRRYYSRTAHMWHEDLARANGETVPPAAALYLRPGPEGLFCTGVQDDIGGDWSFFGFMNLDDLERDLDVEPFLREYVRRLSIVVPDLLWLYDDGPQAYWRGLPISIRGRGTTRPPWTVPRWDRIPHHVVEVLGEAPPLPPETCRLCDVADHKVTPQLIADTIAPAHEQCVKIYRRGETGGILPARRGGPPDMEH